MRRRVELVAQVALVLGADLAEQHGELDDHGAAEAEGLDGGAQRSDGLVARRLGPGVVVDAEDPAVAGGESLLDVLAGRVGDEGRVPEVRDASRAAAARRQLRDAGAAREQRGIDAIDRRRYGGREGQRAPERVGRLAPAGGDREDDRVARRAEPRARGLPKERRAGRPDPGFVLHEAGVRPPRDRAVGQRRREVPNSVLLAAISRQHPAPRPRGARLEFSAVAPSNDRPSVDLADGRHLAGARAPAEAASGAAAHRQTLEGNCRKSRRADAPLLPRARARDVASAVRALHACSAVRGADHRFDDATLVRRLPRQRTACVATRRPPRPRRSHLLARANAGRRAVRGDLLTLPSTTRRSRSSCYRAARAPAAPRAAKRGHRPTRRSPSPSPSRSRRRPSTPTRSGGSARGARSSRCPCRARSSATTRSSRR